MDRRTFLKTAGLSPLGVLLPSIGSAKEKDLCKMLFLSPNFLDEKPNEIVSYFKGANSDPYFIDLAFWDAFKDFNPTEIDFHGAESKYYKDDFKSDIMTNRLLREKYDGAFLPELNLEKGGLSCMVHYCIISDPCYVEATHPCVHDYPFRVKEISGKLVRGFKHKSIFNLNEMGQKKFWSNMLSLMVSPRS
ncbi:MAG: hypothetical protein KKF67_00850 [Nanoarchaeota archaeon]|nr:hypothetical protein [Nanoarchaeota archaeon]